MWEKRVSKEEIPVKGHPRKKSDFEAEWEILSKKIQCKFYQESLFTYSAETDYYGKILAIGDIVIAGDKSIPIHINKSVYVSCKRIPDFMSDITIENDFVNDIASNMSSIIRTTVEPVIIYALNDRQRKDLYSHHYKIYFASGITIPGGFRGDDSDSYNFNYLYGFHFEREENDK